MAGNLVDFLKTIVGRRADEPLDKLQLDAAQDRLQRRADQLDDSVDELTKMIRRLRRERTSRGKPR